MRVLLVPRKRGIWLSILLCKTGEVFGPFGFTAKALFIVMKLYCQQMS